MTFYSPWAFIGMITIPIIILLYILKQKNQEIKISSLFLWEEVLKDVEATAPWQKLQRNLLMFLQIVAALFLVFCLAKPFISGLGGNPSYALIAIDTSMSMQAKENGKTRLEHAKEQASQYVNNLKPGTEITFVSFSKNTVLEENMSLNKSSILDKISNLKESNTANNFDETKSFLNALIKQNPQMEVAVFSDTSFSLQAQVKFGISSGKPMNYAIELFSYSNTAKGITLLSRIANYTDSNAKIPVSLYSNGKVIDAKDVEIPKGETTNVYWTNIPQDPVRMEVRIDRNDALEIDNKAYLVIDRSNIKKAMLISNGNVFLEKAISLTKGLELFKTTIDSAENLKGYDLYIFDGLLPKVLPKDGNFLFFDSPNNQLFQIKGQTAITEVVQLEDDIFQFTKGFTYSIATSKLLTTPAWGKELLSSKEGTLAFNGTVDNRRILAFGFDIRNSDIPLSPAFPILISNSINYLLPRAVSDTESAFSGDSVSFNLNPKAVEASIQDPQNQRIVLAPPFPAKSLDAERPGFYTLSQKTEEGNLQETFAVNPPALRESNLLMPYKEIGESTSGTKANFQPITTGTNLQTILIWTLLAILLLEWWVYKNGI